MCRLNMRSAHGTYHTLQQFIDQADKDGYDEDIDMDFRSVRAARVAADGVGRCAGHRDELAHAFPPAGQGAQGASKSIAADQIAEVFGYAGDRDQALATLYSAGGWQADSDKPAHDERDEGLRRPVCDLILLAFHLVISLLMYVCAHA